jgi:hypothetical protein
MSNPYNLKPTPLKVLSDITYWGAILSYIIAVVTFVKVDSSFYSAGIFFFLIIGVATVMLSLYFKLQGTDNFITKTIHYKVTNDFIFSWFIKIYVFGMASFVWPFAIVAILAFYLVTQVIPVAWKAMQHDEETDNEEN